MTVPPEPDETEPDETEPDETEPDETEPEETEPSSADVGPPSAAALKNGPANDQDDAALLAALRAGDEEAFGSLVARLHRPLVRIASLYVRDRDVAEEVVQESWVAVIRGLDRFEGRSTIRTWVSRIVTYQARTRGERERRTVPLSALLDPDADMGEPAVEPRRFRASPPWQGHWSEPPAAWDTESERRLLARETLDITARAIEALPEAQRTVITLRDVEGWTAEEVCDALELSQGNQRVLLHRARSKVRAVLERYLADVVPG